MGKFGGGGVWRINSFQAFGELIDQPIGYYQFGWFWFGESWIIREIHQTFLLYGIAT